MVLQKVKGVPDFGTPFLFLAARLGIESYSPPERPGSTGVPSSLTASRALGFRPRIFRIVGATWAVSTKLLIARASRLGLDTNSMTLVSSHAKPPCSDCFFRFPV